MALEWAREKEGEMPFVALFFQTLIVAWPRLVPRAGGTNVEELAREVEIEAAKFRDLCPDTAAFVIIVKTVWPAVALPHYTRQPTTLRSVSNEASEIARHIVRSYPRHPDAVGLTDARYLHLTASMLGTYASLWLVLDQLIVQEGEGGPTSQTVQNLIQFALSSAVPA